MMAMLQVFGTLLALVGVLVGVLYLLKKYVPSIGLPRNMSVSEQLHLGDRCRILVVKVRDQELLVGVTRESISILDKLS